MILQANTTHDFKRKHNPRVKRICPYCGKAFLSWVCRIKKGFGRFCSHSCAQKSRTGERSPRWQGGGVLKICQACGANFFVLKGRAKRNLGKFCSQKCSRQGQKRYKGKEHSGFKHGMSGTIEYRRLARHIRRARVNRAVGSHTIEDIQEIFRIQGGRCHYCKKSLRIRFHTDHIKPLSRGGSDSRDNIQLLCPRCNLQKKDKNGFEFAATIGRLF